MSLGWAEVIILLDASVLATQNYQSHNAKEVNIQIATIQNVLIKTHQRIALLENLICLLKNQRARRFYGHNLSRASWLVEDKQIELILPGRVLIRSRKDLLNRASNPKFR